MAVARTRQTKNGTLLNNSRLVGRTAVMVSTIMLAESLEGRVNAAVSNGLSFREVVDSVAGSVGVNPRTFERWISRKRPLPKDPELHKKLEKALIALEK